MSDEKENLTARESLDVITSMIAQAKGNAQENSFYFLLWGWTIMVANLGVYILIKFDVSNPFLFWTVVIPSSVVSAVHGIRQGKNATVSTHLDNINSWIWMAYAITVFIIVAFGYRINWQVNPVILICTAIPTFVTGVLLRFKPLKLGGLAFWILGIAAFLIQNENQFLLAALAITLGYLVPGYMLRTRKD